MSDEQKTHGALVVEVVTGILKLAMDNSENALAHPSIITNPLLGQIAMQLGFIVDELRAANLREATKK